MLSLRVAVAVSLLALLSACSGDATPPVAPKRTPPDSLPGGPVGVIAVNVVGLPQSTAADVVVSGANGFERRLTATATLTGLPLGRYRVTTGTVHVEDGEWVPAVTEQDVLVSAASTVQSVEALYRLVLRRSRIAVQVTGLPGSTPANMVLNGPGGLSRAVTASDTVDANATGDWTLVAEPVTVGGYTYTASPATQTGTLRSRDALLRFSVAYALGTGSIAVSVTGVPAGSAGLVTVTGPNGYLRIVTATETLVDLTPGLYTVSAAPVTVAGVLFQPSPASRTVAVSASVVAQPAPVSYASQSGSIAVTVTGLPSGAIGDVLVAGPAGFSAVVTASTTLEALPPGSYTLTARTVRTSLGSYGGTLSVGALTVAANTTAASTATYTALPSVVMLTVTGVPSGASAALTLTSPSNAVSAPTTSTTLSTAASGRWRLVAATISSGGYRYAPSPASFDQTVLAGDTLRFPVAYTLSTGAIAVTVGGLPNGTNGSVTITGPNDYRQTVAVTTTITDLSPGAYTVAAAAVSAAGISYVPTPASRTLTVSATLVAQAAAVSYTGQFGRLMISASGLPTGAVPNYTLSGASSRSITGAGTADSLPSGAYRVAAMPVVSGGSTFVPTPTESAVTIATGATAATSFSYASSTGGGGLNVRIAGAYLTQAVQRMDGSVPLVSGRAALLRVFVVASGANSLSPTIRVRLYSAGVPYQTLTIPAPAVGVPLSVNEGVLSDSWNAVVAAGDMRTDMQVVADIAPSTPLDDANVADNTWPETGARTFDVRSVAPMSIRFVPIRNSADGLTGNVTSLNAEGLTADVRRVHPLGQVNVSVRSTFTSAVTGGLQSSDGNGAWNSMLNELEALRTIEGGGLTHYVGVVSTTYGSGMAGLAYVGGRTSVNWDKSGAASVIAHEVGHNFGRSHAPGCGTTQLDGAYPDGTGKSDAWGWNGAALLNPSSTYDIMSYCAPTWVSAYGWGRVMNNRQIFGGMVAAAQVAEGPSVWARQSSIVIWGTVQHGTVTLQPALVVETTPSVPGAGMGTYRLDMVDERGNVMRSIRFDASPTDHQRAVEGFAMAIPLAGMSSGIAELRLFRGAEVVARQRGVSVAGAADSAPVAFQRRGRRVSVAWNSVSWPLLLVQDAVTGDVLGLLRDGQAEFDRPTSGPIVITLSDGVRSRTVRKSFL